MSAFPILARSIRELSWMVAWFGLGLALYAASMVWIFPMFEGYIDTLSEGYPEAFLEFFGGGDLADPAGFLTLEYQSFAVVIFIIYAVTATTGQLAGEEGRGTLEMVLAQPVSRARLIMEKAAACLLGAVLICLLICVGWLASVPFVDLHGQVGLLDVFGATFGALPVVACFGALGFLLGAIAPSRGIAAGILTGIVVLGYLAASLGQAIEPVSWMQYASPYYYSGTARWLTEGPIWWHQAALVVATAVCFALAVRAFTGREVGAGTWQVGAMLRGVRATSRQES